MNARDPVDLATPQLKLNHEYHAVNQPVQAFRNHNRHSEANVDVKTKNRIDVFASESFFYYLKPTIMTCHWKTVFALNHSI